MKIPVKLLLRLRAFKEKMILLFLGDNTFYINGPQTLPPPLCREEEQKCIDRIRNGDESAREPLIVHNLRLVVYIAKKFENSGAGVEDLISIGTIGLIKLSIPSAPTRTLSSPPTLQGALRTRF